MFVNGIHFSVTDYIEKVIQSIPPAPLVPEEKKQSSTVTEEEDTFQDQNGFAPSSYECVESSADNRDAPLQFDMQEEVVVMDTPSSNDIDTPMVFDDQSDASEYFDGQHISTANSYEMEVEHDEESETNNSHMLKHLCRSCSIHPVEENALDGMEVDHDEESETNNSHMLTHLCGSCSIHPVEENTLDAMRIGKDEPETSDHDRERCPSVNCTGTLKKWPNIPGEAFCKPKKKKIEFYTSCCECCGANFRHIDVLKQRLQNFMAKKKIVITEEDIDHFRCTPPSEDYKTPGTEEAWKEQALFAWILLDYQFHYEGHASSCFKVTSRTPKAIVCRFLFPRLTRLLEAFVNNRGKIEMHNIFIS